MDADSPAWLNVCLGCQKSRRFRRLRAGQAWARSCRCNQLRMIYRPAHLLQRLDPFVAYFDVSNSFSLARREASLPNRPVTAVFGGGPVQRKRWLAAAVLIGLVFLLPAPLMADAIYVQPVQADDYSAWVGSSSASPTPNAASIFIQGPGGLEEFKLNVGVDVAGPLLLNTYGQAVFAGETTDDPYLLFAIYGSGGSDGIAGGFGNGTGFQPGALVTGNFGSLGWPWLWQAPEGLLAMWGGPGQVTLAGLDTAGLVAGVLHYDVNFTMGEQGQFDVPVTWQLGDQQPIPEPSSLILLGTGLAVVRAWRKRRA